MVPMTDDTQLRAINQSQVKAWRRCQRLWHYRFGLQLVPRRHELPLYKGSWVHACLETHYRDGDWKIGFNQYLEHYNSLFDEERAVLNKRGNLPEVVKQIMRSYLWYYRNDGWEPVIVEKEFDFVFRGVRFKGRIDLAVRDAEGFVWMVDHKTASTIPQASSFHAMDPQLMLYPWAATREFGIDITGVIWNYVRSRPPSIPKLNRDGSISRRKILTDYPTAVRFLKSQGLELGDYSDFLRPLQRSSPFLRRYRLPREDHVLKTIISEYITTAKEIYTHRAVVRNITRDCPRCAYQPICQADLNGFDTETMKRRDYMPEPQEGLLSGKRDTTELSDDDWEG